MIPVEASLFEVVSQSLLVAVASIAVHRDIGRCSFTINPRCCRAPDVTVPVMRNEEPLSGRLHSITKHYCGSKVITGAAML
jgi:hypothetical protein